MLQSLQEVATATERLIEALLCCQSPCLRCQSAEIPNHGGRRKLRWYQNHINQSRKTAKVLNAKNEGYDPSDKCVGPMCHQIELYS